MKTDSYIKAGISLLLFILFTNTWLSATENWKQTDSKSGVTVYERWVPVSTDLSVKERKGEMVISGTLKSVISTLSDPVKTKLWMENVSDAYLVSQKSDELWYSYTYFSLPWPFENRDMVAVSKLKYSSGGTSATIEIVSRENVLPVKENAKRLHNYKATWEIVDKGKGDIYISFSAISYTAPEYPRFIQDPVLRGTFLRNLINLKTILIG